MITVALDAMGGDNAPAEIVAGAVDAVKEHNDIRVLLTGREDAINEELKKDTYPEGSITVIPASEVIETAESPVNAIRQKKDSSMVVGMNLVKNGEADAFVSAGNSGALLAGGQLIVGRIKGVERAPFGALLPTKNGSSLLLDAGASVDPRPSMLVQFAQMGYIYMRDVCGVENPTVGIVNIGEEEEKGNALVKETFPLLKECPDINFTGSVEARAIPEGGTDVIVTDAFTGNVVLKMYEGTISTLFHMLTDALYSSFRSKVGAVLILPALRGMIKSLNLDSQGGAPMLGLKGLVVKAHGNSKRAEIHNAIVQCQTFKDRRINEKISEALRLSGEDRSDKET